MLHRIMDLIEQSYWLLKSIYGYSYQKDCNSYDQEISDVMEGFARNF